MFNINLYDDELRMNGYNLIEEDYKFYRNTTDGCIKDSSYSVTISLMYEAKDPDRLLAITIKQSMIDGFHMYAKALNGSYCDRRGGTELTDFEMYALSQILKNFRKTLEGESIDLTFNTNSEEK